MKIQQIHRYSVLESRFLVESKPTFRFVGGLGQEVLHITLVASDQR